MTTTATITDQVLATNDGYITADELPLVLAGTEGVRVNVLEQRKSKKYRIVAHVGVLDTEGGFWGAGEPQVFYAQPTRNFGRPEMVAYFAKKVAPGLEVI